MSGVQPVSVTAGDNVGVANGAIMIDGTIVASFSGKAATYNWNTSQSKTGGHKLQSKVQDTAGNVGMSAPVAVTVALPSSDTTPPNVTITYPKSATTVASGAQTVTSSVSDDVGVTLVKTALNGTVICQQTAPPYSCPVSLSGSLATIDVTAFDAAGNTRTAEVNVHVTSGGSSSGGSTSGSGGQDTTSPSVTITYPKSATTVASGAQTVTSSVSDDVGVTLVKTALNGTVVCQKTAPPYSCPVSLSGSLATIDVTAFDAAGNTRTAEVNVHVTSGGSSSGGSTSGSGGQDTAPPRVTITYPPSGISMIRGAKTYITARTSDNRQIALVKTYVNGSLICEQSSSTSFCPWTVWNVAKAQIQVKAFDSAGNAGAGSVSVFPR